MIARILNYKVMDLILRLAREKGELRYGAGQVMIFPDYSLQVQRNRRSYDKVKQKLRALIIRYMLMYQAKRCLACLELVPSPIHSYLGSTSLTCSA